MSMEYQSINREQFNLLADAYGNLHKALYCLTMFDVMLDEENSMIKNRIEEIKKEQEKILLLMYGYEIEE